MARYDNETQQEVTAGAGNQSGESLEERQRQQLAVIVGIAVHLKNDEVNSYQCITEKEEEIRLPAMTIITPIIYRLVHKRLLWFF